jgi:Zn finger protein HypA/HybF involved in hydrogenase expression
MIYELNTCRTFCESCDTVYPSGEYVEGDHCPECDSVVLEVEEYNPTDEPEYWV